MTESFSSLRGQANAELSRIKALRKISNMQIDVYSFAIYEGWLVRKLRHTAKEETPLSKIVEDVKISFKWRKFSLIDYVLTVKLNKAPIVNRNWMLKYVDMFAGYDLIMSHSADCGELLMAIRDKYKIPFYVTWHGSDIHTWPFSSRYAWSYTKKYWTMQRLILWLVKPCWKQRIKSLQKRTRWFYIMAMMIRNLLDMRIQRESC